MTVTWITYIPNGCGRVMLPRRPAQEASMPKGAQRAAGPQPAARPPRTGTAPGELEIVRRFVNTLDLEAGTDELDSAAALLTWLGRHGLADPGAAHGRDGPARTAVTAADLKRAVALREALRGVLRSHVRAAAQPGGAAAGAAAAELRRIAATLRTRLEVRDDGRVAPAPAGSGVAAALARILLIAAEAGSNGTWSRLKACSAADCQWAFYDRSPTRSGCWCSMRVCGSRSKSRAYRSRRIMASGL
jgi:predicted RNA-binding Zn ribbon-like protein